jgi:hypothetical protein
MSFLEWFSFACCLILYACYWRVKHQAKREIGNLKIQRDEAQDRFEDHARELRKETAHNNELQDLLQKAGRRSEGYGDILVRLFDGFRKASDEYEKVRRGK